MSDEMNVSKQLSILTEDGFIHSKIVVRPTKITLEVSQDLINLVESDPNLLNSKITSNKSWPY